MPVPRPAGCLIVAMLALAAGGCGGTKSKPVKVRKPIVPAAVDGDAALTLDDGRITVSPPVGWKREPRSQEYLACYLPRGGKTHPSVTVFAGDPPAGITAVDAANHAEFAAAMTAALAEQFTDAEGTGALLRQPEPVELGPHKAVVWTAQGTAKVGGLARPAERSFTAVVLAGRLYTVEARAPKGQLDDAGRAAGRGVAAGIAVPVTPEPAAEVPAEPQDGPPAAAEPAEAG